MTTRDIQSTLGNTVFYEEEEEECVDPVSRPVSGASELTYPTNIEDGVMEQAISSYVESVNSDSPILGIEHVLVAGAKNADVHPFLIVGLAQKESVLGLTGPGVDSWNVENANNLFGRTATESQPHIPSPSNPDRLWYTWESVEASFDHTRPENAEVSGGGDIAAYIRNVYSEELDAGDLSAFMHRYAPPSENDTELYISQLNEAMETMRGLALGADQASAQTSPRSSAGEGNPCLCGAGAGTPVDGSDVSDMVWNFLVGEMGFSDIQAAGIMGNIQAESSFNPVAVNPSSGAYGLVQWYSGRLTALENFAREQGGDKSEVSIQLDFLKHELETGYRESVLEPIKASDNLVEVTRIFLERFEVPCLPGSSECESALNARMVFSEEWLSGLGGSSLSPGSSGCPTGASSGNFIWPLDSQYAVSSCFGLRWGRLHGGIDIGAPAGVPIMAADGGTVTLAGNTDGFGQTVVIDHGNGWWTLYAHMQTDSIIVSEGEGVAQGQIVGNVNNTGSSGGDHLHFNIQTSGAASYQDAVDPLPHLPPDPNRGISGTNCPSSLA